MYQDGWNSVSGDELKGFLGQVNPIDGKYKCSEASTLVEWRALPFYEKVVLIRIRDDNWAPGNLVLYYLADQGQLFRLNGTSPPIHEVNANAPIKLNEYIILDYLRFFCFFVRGEEGPFLIAESMDDPYLPKNMDEKTKAVIEGSIRPAAYDGKNEKGHHLANAVVFYSNAMFIAHFSIQETGLIEMLDDELLAGDLPTKIDAPIA